MPRAQRKHVEITTNTQEQVLAQVIALLWTYDHDQLKEIARLSRVSTQTLYNWRTDKTKNPWLTTFARVARTLGWEITLSHKEPGKRRVTLTTIPGGKA